jgi:inward rectifier potassium channel
MASFKEKSRINDPGFGEKVTGKVDRLINKDGSFNMHRKGGDGSFQNIYQKLLGISGWRFFGLILGCYVVINLLFALVYFSIGPENLNGMSGKTDFEKFMGCFYFSAQTFTTVGYGAMAPKSALASTVSALEALTGLMSFAVGTGLLYTRFSQPKAKLVFSKNAIIAPYKEGKAFMFRFANARNNVLMNMSARVIMSIREADDITSNRKFFDIPLDPSEVMFLALSWTLVHEINESSPLNDLTFEQLKHRNAEFLILISGFDDTFNQTVHCRHSYIAKEVVVGAKFIKAFHQDEKGHTILELDKISSYEPYNLSL